MDEKNRLEENRKARQKELHRFFLAVFVLICLIHLGGIMIRFLFR